MGKEGMGGGNVGSKHWKAFRLVKLDVTVPSDGGDLISRGPADRKGTATVDDK